MEMHPSWLMACHEQMAGSRTSKAVAGPPHRRQLDGERGAARLRVRGLRVRRSVPLRVTRERNLPELVFVDDESLGREAVEEVAEAFVAQLEGAAQLSTRHGRRTQ